jgi:NADPH:quinone reductase-like Zn-dependent oxidoreductase
VVDEAPDGGPWRIGDEVVAIVVPFHQRPGAYAEGVVVPVGSVGPRPRVCDFPTAATLPMSGLTASALLTLLDLHPKDTLAVTGAGGVVGGLVLQLARHAGVTVIADAPGGDDQIDRDDDYPTQIRRLCPDGVDAAVDAALIGEPLLEAVRDGGALASLRVVQLPPQRGISVLGVSVWDYAQDAPRLAELCSLVDEGHVVLPAARTFTPEEAGAAHERLGVRGQRARGVLVW